jgi:2-polyprenyl-3-methyl-5-hydroxy-6-metoxy-1,4-benzoquinol methylase
LSTRNRHAGSDGRHGIIGFVLLQWLDGAIDVPCPVCGRVEDQALIASAVVDWQDSQVQIARCRDCNALVMDAVEPASAHADAVWDRYIEHTAGLEAIDAALVKIGAPRGSRVLDVGCGYGFALDLAARRFGWQGIGLDPSDVAARGREELGLDVRTGRLDDSFGEGPFDVVVAIEMIEHLSDPVAFLGNVHRCLVPDGVALITTPDASALHPDTPGAVLEAVLSLGEHAFLVDEDGLRRLLSRAGFEARVWTQDHTLWALASPTARGLRGTRQAAKPDLVGLMQYCDDRGRSAAPGSSLALGMSARSVKFATTAGLHRRAEAAVPRLRTALLNRYLCDVDDPLAVASMDSPPDVLAPIHFYVGLLAFYRRDWAEADAHFRAVVAVGEHSYEGYGVYRDPETPVLEARALEHRVLVAANIAPDRVPVAIEELHEALKRSWADPWTLVRYRDQTVKELAGSPLRRVRQAWDRRRRATSARATHVAREVRSRAPIRGRRPSGRRASAARPAAGDPSESPRRADR